MKRPIVFLSTVALALLGTTSLAGCGSDSDTAVSTDSETTQTVEQQDGKLAEVEGFSAGDRVDNEVLKSAVDTAMEGKWVYKMHGEGTMIFEGQIFSMLMDIDVDQTDPSNFKSRWVYDYPDLETGFQMVSVGGTTWEKDNDEDKWHVSDTQVDSEITGVDSSILSAYFGAANSIRYEGEEEVDGETYSKYVADTGPEGVVTVWLNESNEIRKAKIVVPADPGEGLSEIVFDAYDFGEPVTIEAPDPADVE